MYHTYVLYGDKLNAIQEVGLVFDKCSICNNKLIL